MNKKAKNQKKLNQLKRRDGINNRKPVEIDPQEKNSSRIRHSARITSKNWNN